ncbi:MAG: glycosyltransferase family 8 protein [Synechococcales cyanobacterium]
MAITNNALQLLDRYSPSSSEAFESKSIAEPIVLVATVDDNYVMPMTVTVHSAFKNLKSSTSKICLYVVDGGIKQSSKEKAEATLKSDRLEIIWLRPNLERLGIIPRDIILAYYYRLLMAEILPKEVSRAIYLDADMIVLGDLQDLWDMDMEDSFVMAAINGNHLSTAPGLSNYRELNLDPKAEYFNAGLLVANLDKWRETNIAAVFFDFLEKNKDTIKTHDQDILNAVLAGRWKKISSQWNQLPFFVYGPYAHDPKHNPFKDSETLHQVATNPYVIHYGGMVKPWQLNCDHPSVHIFEKYLDETAWAGTRDSQLKKTKRKWNSFVRKYIRKFTF